MFKRRYFSNNFPSGPLKKSIFIFGSGSSLKTISDLDFKKISDIGDTMGFNSVVNLEKVNWDYFIVREFEQKIISFGKFVVESIFNFEILKEFNSKISNSLYFCNTKFLICSDRKCGQSLLLLLYFNNFLKKKILYTNNLDRRINWPPSNNRFNIPHGNATLNDAINLSYIAGYTEIVLVGVDLYDSRYFYLNEDETRSFDKIRNRNHKMKHNTSESIVENLKLWKVFLNSKNVSIKVLNPNSLAANVIDVYKLV